jgi:hypothetical protein
MGPVEWVGLAEEARFALLLPIYYYVCAVKRWKPFTSVGCTRHVIHNTDWSPMGAISTRYICSMFGLSEVGTGTSQSTVQLWAAEMYIYVYTIYICHSWVTFDT